jgi:hypothetical protein
VENYEVDTHHIGHRDGAGWAVAYEFNVLLGRTKIFNYDISGKQVMVPDHMIPIGPYVRGIVQVEMFATDYFGLIRCRCVNSVTYAVTCAFDAMQVS